MDHNIYLPPKRLAICCTKIGCNFGTKTPKIDEMPQLMYAFTSTGEPEPLESFLLEFKKHGDAWAVEDNKNIVCKQKFHN